MSISTYKKNGLCMALLSVMTQGAYSDGEELALEEVVVTAERRSENIQDIPASVSAITGDAAERLGIKDVNDLQNFIPGLTIKSQSKGNTAFNIRGVGETNDDISVESGVGVFIDDIYLPRMAASGGALFDLERIEVLRGPQGTLYGRNTAGGSINFITKKPSDYFEGKVSAELGDRNIHNVKAYISGPLVDDKLSGKFSFVSEDADGYMKNVKSGQKGNGEHVRAGRVGLRYSVNKAIEISFTADAEVQDGDPTMMNVGPEGGYMTQTHELLAMFGVLDGSGEPATRFYESNIDNDGKEQVENWGLMLRADVIHDDFDAAYIFGYRGSELDLDADRDQAPISLFNESHQEDSEWGSFEVRFSSTPEGGLSLGGKLEWTAGLYYFIEDGARDVRFYGDDVAALLTGGAVDMRHSLGWDQEIETEAYAAFGQVTVSLTDAARVTSGLRWTEEEKTLGLSNSLAFFEPGDTPVIEELYDIQATERWDDVTLKFGFEYDLNDETLLFAQYSEGFKSGGFNGTSASAALARTAFEPEDVANTEVGIKTTLASRLQLNFSIFDMDYENLQTTIVTSGGAPMVFNATADIRGAELEIVALLIKNLTLGVSAGYIDSEYTEFESNPDNEGRRVNGVPEWKYSVSADYVMPVSGGRFGVHADYSWEGETSSVPGAQGLKPIANLEDWDVANISVNYQPDSGRWEIEAWVRNVADSKYWLSNGSSRGDSSPENSLVRYAAAPRTSGLTFTYFLGM
ncbi:TonB-dependent receptor [Exilibacterium tricleocarpae]|uniref:TonB-dependent receptor n=1 Tax=Exilibacterium tricleocarpae TaxID=2591008 RepID=A0A545TLP8_9GAMM|nr:TonB-dependent receptor [Exilibacterium tricleocarpae]TQV78170.1 TonB-dependent receptor [Exilibacterium tricleocarpae]